MVRSKTRLLIEITASVALVTIAWLQRADIAAAIRTALAIQPLHLLILCIVGGLNYLWAAVAYRALSPKPLRLLPTIYASLAASGPGRVLPGGAGHASVMALYLKKSTYGLRAALTIITIATMGAFALHSTVVFFVSVFFGTGISGHTTLPMAAFTLVALTGAALVMYISKHPRLKRRHFKEWRAVHRMLTRSPDRIILFVLAAGAQIATHTYLMWSCAQLSGHAIDPAVALYAVSAGVAAGSLVLTPGGVGGVEAGAVALLTANGLTVPAALTTVLLYRFITYIVPILPGICAYVFLRRRALL